MIVDMQHWRDALRISFNRTVGSRYSLNKKYLPSPVLSTDKLNTLEWILSSTSTVQSRIWMSLSLPPSLAIRPWCLPPAQNQDLWPRERRRTKFDRYTHINLVPFILETTGRPGPQARKFINFLLRDADPTKSCQRHLVHHPKCPPQCHLQTTTYGSRYVTLGDCCDTQFCFVCTVLMDASTAPPGIKTAFSVSSLLQLCHVALL